jgi:alpha-L-fucosidase 2
MDAYQSFGDLFLTLQGAAGAVADYRRELDLTTATACTRFRVDGVLHRRKAFVRHPDQVVVLRWTADRPEAISGLVELNRAHGAARNFRMLCVRTSA